MCIGVPMEVIDSDGHTATCRTRDGVVEQIDMRLVGPLPAGQWVLTFMGAARSLLDRAEAERVCDALEAMAAALRGDSVDHLFADLVNREPQLPPHLKPDPKGRSQAPD